MKISKFSLFPVFKEEYLYQITRFLREDCAENEFDKAECVICTDISEMFRFLHVKYKMSLSRGVRLTNLSQLVCFQKEICGLKKNWIAPMPTELSCHCLKSETLKHPIIRNVTLLLELAQIVL